MKTFTPGFVSSSIAGFKKLIQTATVFFFVLMIVVIQSCKQNPAPADQAVDLKTKKQATAAGSNNPAQVSAANSSPSSNVAANKISFSKSEKRNKHFEDEDDNGEENEEDGMKEAMEQEFLKTQDPALHLVPTERMVRASQKVDEIMKASASQRTTALPWAERGPNNVGGRTRAIMVDMNDASGNTVFAGSVGGGIWKSANFTTAAYTWSKVNDNMTNLAITALVQNPVTPTTMYAGTGEGFFNSDAIKGGGIFKSTDGGTSWAVLSSTVPSSSNRNFDYVQDVVVTSDGVLYAATRGTACNFGGIFKSIDEGTTWTQAIGNYNNSGACSGAFYMRGADLEIAANGDLYATTGLTDASGANDYGKVWKSPASLGATQGNFGQWTNVTPVPPGSDPGFGRIEIACAPTDNQFLYALCQTYNTSAIRRLYKSINGGTAWTEVVPPTWCDQGSSSSDFTRGQAWYDLIAAIDPNTSNNIYIGAVDIMKSTNAGSSFSQLTQWASGCASLPFIHADNHNIVFMNGSSSNIIISNDGGIFFTNNGGATFSNKNSGYNVTQYYAVAIHPTTTNYFLAGAQDNGTQKFTTAGINAASTFTGGDGGFCHISQKNPLIQISSFTNSNYRISRDGGNTISQSINNTGGRFINPSSYDEDAGILYRGSGAGALGRVNNVATGTATSTSVNIAALGTTSISTVTADPNETNTVWLGGSGSVAPVILKVVDAHTATPTVTNVSIPSAGTSWYVSNIDVERGNSNHLLVTFSNFGVTTVWESINGGTSWVAIQGNLPDMPVRWGMFLPSGSSEGMIALATELGVFTTSVTNGASTSWITNNTGFPRVRTDMLKYRKSDNTIIAATHGRGLFTAIIPVSPITWTGAVDNNWNVAGNWSSGRVPNGYDDVTIPALSPNMPILVTDSRGIYTLNVGDGATLKITGKLRAAK